MQSHGMVERVKQEVAIHSKLKHPSILELYTFFEDAKYVYLVLELAHNGELHRFLKGNKRVSLFIWSITDRSNNNIMTTHYFNRNFVGHDRS